ncbi:MAG: DUF177 domain-containing protein [Gammaproteobacteria bacterium]|nr:DUF177 domain-containing protein [Gammaproteobacteria bacterium]
MSERPLQKIIEPFKLVSTRALVDGFVAFSALSRLREELSSVSPDVDVAHVELAFQRDPQGYVLASGSIRAKGGVVCQRCLGTIPVLLDTPISWAFIVNEETSCDVPRAYDVIVVEEESVSLYDLVEDELILALPPIPMHAEGQCAAPNYVSPNEEQIERSEEKKNPFEVLSEIRKKH